MKDVLLSFLALISIPIAVIFVTALVRKWCFRKPWPPARSLVRDGLQSIVITVAISLAICGVLTWTGFIQSQAYRPTTKDHGEQTKLGLKPEDIFFQSEDGTRLHGWFVPSKTPAVGTVIHFHGSDRNVTFTIRNSYWLTEHGFNLFVFDYRGYGKSEGRPSRRGTVEDSVAAIRYVRSRPDVNPTNLVLWGQSLGGQLAIVAAGMAGTEGIQAVVAEATYSSYSHQVKDKLAGMGPLWLVQWAVWLITPDTYAARDTVNRLAPSRLLVVHGTADRAVRSYHSEELFRLAAEPKNKWIVDGVGHLQVFHDARYREKLVEFLTPSVQRGEATAGVRQGRARLRRPRRGQRGATPGVRPSRWTAP